MTIVEIIVVCICLVGAGLGVAALKNHNEILGF